MNYDVSYVNGLTAPVAMEASNVPITVGNQLDTTTPPTYYGYQDYGWNPTTRNPISFTTLLNDFVQNGPTTQPRFWATISAEKASRSTIIPARAIS